MQSSMLTTVCFILLSKTLFVNCLSISMPVSSLTIHEFGQCPGKNELTILIANTTVNQNAPFSTIITGKLILRDIVDYPFSLRATLMKCETRVEATCEHYTTTKFADICRFMPFWVKIFNNSDLPTSCPFSVGEYRINGMQFDSNTLRVLPLTESHWKATSRMYKHDKLIGCVISKFEIRKERRKARL